MSDRFLFRLFAALSALVLLAAGSVAIFLLSAGAEPFFSGEGASFFGLRWAPLDIPPSFGMLSFLAGTISTAVCTLLLSVPAAVLTAVYLCWFCPSILMRPLVFVIDMMAGIPAVLYGLWGASVLVPLVQTYIGGTGESVLAASAVMAMMAAPTVCAVTLTALKGVPKSYYTGARALGITHEYAVFRIMMPPAIPGILAAVVLAAGRIMGETMVVVMTAGNQPWVPVSWLEGTRTLSGNLFIEMAYSSGSAAAALISEGLVLMVIIFCMSVMFFWLRRKMA